MRIACPVDLQDVRDGPPEDHCVLATFSDLPEANTFGKNLADALSSAVDCLDAVLDARLSDRNVPRPSAANRKPVVSPSMNPTVPSLKI